MNGMPYADLLNAVIDDGQMEVRERFGSRPNARLRLDGAIEGFEACRGKPPQDLRLLAQEAKRRTDRARVIQAADYWFWRERELQIEWTNGVIAAALYMSNQPDETVFTANQYRKALTVLGVDLSRLMESGEGAG